MDAYTSDMYSLHFIVMIGGFMSGTSLEPSKSIGAFPDVPDLATSGEEAYVYFHLDPKHTNFINRIIEGYEYLGL